MTTRIRRFARFVVRMNIPFILAVSGTVHYARRRRASPPAPAAAPPAGQLGRDFVPGGADRRRTGADGSLVGPVIGIETLQPLGQPVPVLGGARAPHDPLRDVLVALAQPRRLGRAQHPAEQRRVFDDDRFSWRTRGRRPIAAAIPIAIAPGALPAIDTIRPLGADLGRLLPQRHPIE